MITSPLRLTRTPPNTTSPTGVGSAKADIAIAVYIAVLNSGFSKSVFLFMRILKIVFSK